MFQLLPSGGIFLLTPGTDLFDLYVIIIIVVIIIIIIISFTARVVGAPQMISQLVCPFFPALLCPLGIDELQACPFPDVVFPPFPLPALSTSPFHFSPDVILCGRLGSKHQLTN